VPTSRAVRVKSDFEFIYREFDDPWDIGAADSARYEGYRRTILDAATARGSMLDIGTGMGAFLARFEDDFERLVGVEVSAVGVERGRERHPSIEFVRGSATELDDSPLDGQHFDAIVYSDVINYFRESGKRRSLDWIARHLTDDGLAFIAAWSPGGKYLDRHEFRRLVNRWFAVEREEVLESGHVAFVCRRKRRLAALTVDYETWQPLPEGWTIDWERDVLRPAAMLLDLGDGAGAPLTLMVEAGEYLWLRENEPDVAERIEEQCRDAVRRGHDVQLHLHPNWLPETGVRRDGERWHWDPALAIAADYPGDLSEAIGRCKATLEAAVRGADPTFEITCFRAGTYEAQPFDRLHDALVASGIRCDSSVLPGDRRDDRRYDYRLAYSRHQPYFASRSDPQLKAPPAEREIVELPVFAVEPGVRWTFDNDEAGRFGDRLLRHARRAERLAPTVALRVRRRTQLLLQEAYWRTRRARRLVNSVMPRRVAWFMVGYEPERLVGHDYHVLVSHTKADLDGQAIRRGLDALSAGGVEIVTLREMARIARAELEGSTTSDAGEEAERQVEREYATVMSEDHNFAQSDRLQRMIPLDRRRVLDAGCGAGEWTARIAGLLPQASSVGIDVGEDFVSEAERRHGGARVSFRVEDFGQLSFPDAAFDCVYADNSLEHAFDVDRSLAELYRVLAPGGALVAGIPADAVNPGRTCDNHTWKTAPADVRRRLEWAGFGDVSIEEVDVFRTLGMAPYPPSRDILLYVRAWREPPGPRERVVALTRWAYETLDPEHAQPSDDPMEILAAGHAWCWGYVLVLGDALRREGFGVRWASMVAHDHPRGLGEERRESHEVLEVDVDGETVVCDPMAGRVFDGSVEDLLRDPSVAAAGGDGDERWRARSYDLYASPEWYSRVVRLAMRDDPHGRLRFRSAVRS
jgi:ubiquinone/menaquinone biosynthesis C-methylase UbiE